MKGIAIKLFFTCFIIATLSVSHAQQGSGKNIELSALDLSKMTCVMGLPKTGRCITGAAMRIANETFLKGVGTHAYSRMLIDLHGRASSFTAKVGLDDAAYVHASISFFVLGDGKLLWASGPMKKGDKAKVIDVNLTGIRKMGLLVTVNREDISENYADWADAQISYLGEQPVALDNVTKDAQLGILTPAAPLAPRINGPAVYGVRPNSPFLYRIPATGKRPMVFEIDALPKGLKLDAVTGIITGTITTPGRYTVKLNARNSFGTNHKTFTVVAGNELALTPPMGWNSWYIYYHHVSDSFMRMSADAMIRSGMADYGYQYVNIDDCWMNKPGSKDAEENGPARDADGNILGNKRFPDMKGLSDYIHSKGLKAGIYSSPGPLTCAGYTASYGHELQDAQTFAAWGYDFLKYDWCSYGSVAGGKAIEALKAPFLVMGDALKKTGRDIVFNLCQYGMGDVWTWGKEAGHSWRTGPDLGTATGSFIPGFYNTGLSNSAHWQYAGPGAWNDPDYITIGWVGSSDRNKQGRKTGLTTNEQYAYMSMWSLMASPLFFSGDMNKLDAFTLNVLCNNEVIAVNQDALGQQARIVRNDSTGMVMTKHLSDGSIAVGLFNFPGSKHNPADYFIWDENAVGSRNITLSSTELGLKGRFRVRDLWTQKDFGTSNKKCTINVPYHSAVLLKISQ